MAGSTRGREKFASRLTIVPRAVAIKPFPITWIHF
jgi:hypothetical protein